MSKPLKVKKLSPGDSIQTAAVKILRTRIKEFYSHWSAPDQVPTLEQLHNLRISGKRLRYSAEQLRELYPGRLALLIDLLKRNQDLLGEIQDCVTQRAVIETELSKLRLRNSGHQDLTAFEELIAEYDQRRQMMFGQFHEIWKGMALVEFREALKAMASGVSSERCGVDAPQTFPETARSE